MTPKAKAEELIHKMYKAHSGSYSSITFSISKQCAKVLVREITDVLEKDHNESMSEQVREQIGPFESTEYFHYWQSVLLEIENL